MGNGVGPWLNCTVALRVLMSLTIIRRPAGKGCIRNQGNKGGWCLLRQWGIGKRECRYLEEHRVDMDGLPGVDAALG